MNATLLIAVAAAAALCGGGPAAPAAPQRTAAAAARRVITLVVTQQVTVAVTAAVPAVAAASELAPEPALEAREVPDAAALLSTSVLAVVNTAVVPVDEFVKIFANEQLDKLPLYLRREYNQGRERFVNQLIDNEVLAQAAADEDFSQDAGYAKELREAQRQLQIRHYYQQRIGSRVGVADAAVQAYYTAHRDEYAEPERIRVRHILVALKKGAYPAEISNAWDRIRRLRLRVREGESFADVARTDSDCPSKKDGGDLGYRQAGQMVPSFEHAAFALKRNEVSEIVQTEFGYHLIQMVDRIPGRQRAFAEVKDEIKQNLAQQREQELYRGLLATLTNRYKVLRNETLIDQLVHGM